MISARISLFFAEPIHYLNQTRSLGGLGCLFGYSQKLVQAVEQCKSRCALGL